MFKTPLLAAAVLGAVLSAGAVMNTGIAKADPPGGGCAPGQQCMPQGNHHHFPGNGNMKPPGGGSGGMPHPGGNPPGQMGWDHHMHHHGNGNWGDPGVGVGIYLGNGYNNGYDGNYNGDDRPDYGDYVSCGEAKSIVRSRGYYNVRTESCDPGDYTFLGSKRGERFEIEVAGDGRIVSVDSAE
jgi:hypothetical protein